VIAANRGATEG
jgi:hypothetical protein